MQDTKPDPVSLCGFPLLEIAAGDAEKAGRVSQAFGEKEAQGRSLAEVYQALKEVNEGGAERPLPFSASSRACDHRQVLPYRT